MLVYIFLNGLRIVRRKEFVLCVSQKTLGLTTKKIMTLVFINEFALTNTYSYFKLKQNKIKT